MLEEGVAEDEGWVRCCGLRGVDRAVELENGCRTSGACLFYSRFLNQKESESNGITMVVLAKKKGGPRGSDPYGSGGAHACVYFDLAEMGSLELLAIMFLIADVGCIQSRGRVEEIADRLGGLGVGIPVRLDLFGLIVHEWVARVAVLIAVRAAR